MRAGRAARSARAMAAFGVVAVAMLGCVGPAGAHVSVEPSEAAQGGFAKLAFSVPNERPDSSTVSLRVQLPEDHPFAFVSVKPKVGWTATPVESTLATPIGAEGETITEAVTETTWSGGQINSGEFDEPELPAPTLTLTAATGDEHGSATGAATAGDDGTASTEAAAADDTGDDDGDSATTSAVVALVVGAAGVLLAGFALARASRSG